ncbi:MAG: hypothetical protein R2712_30490 [Vicinamibacterales bacterium]
MRRDGALVADALAGGARVLAGADAARELVLQGVRVGPGDRATPVMREVEGTFRCVAVRADRLDAAGLEYRPHGRRGPCRRRQLKLIVGDSLPPVVRVDTPGRPDGPDARGRPVERAGSEAPPADYWIESGRPGSPGPAPGEPAAPRIPSGAHRLVSVRLGRRARVIARLSGFRGRSSRPRVRRRWATASGVRRRRDDDTRADRRLRRFRPRLVRRRGHRRAALRGGRTPMRWCWCDPPRRQAWPSP